MNKVCIENGPILFVKTNPVRYDCFGLIRIKDPVPTVAGLHACPEVLRQSKIVLCRVVWKTEALKYKHHC